MTRNARNVVTKFLTKLFVMCNHIFPTQTFDFLCNISTKVQGCVQNSRYKIKYMYNIRVMIFFSNVYTSNTITRNLRENYKNSLNRSIWSIYD